MTQLRKRSALKRLRMLLELIASRSVGRQRGPRQLRLMLWMRLQERRFLQQMLRRRQRIF